MAQPHPAEPVSQPALRRELGFDLLERIWARNDMPEDEAIALAVEAQHEMRKTALD